MNSRKRDFLTSNFLVDEPKQDCIIQKLEKQGIFSVKLGLKSIIQPQMKINWARLVWSASNIPRHSFIFWLTLQKRLLRKNKLFKGKVIDSNMCVLCKYARENVEHLFFECVYSKAVWKHVLVAINVKRNPLLWNREVRQFTRKASGKSMIAKIRRMTMAGSIYTI